MEENSMLLFLKKKNAESEDTFVEKAMPKFGI